MLPRLIAQVSALVLSVVALASCGSDPASALPATALWPRAANDSWEYEVFTVSDAGEESPRRIETVRVLRDTTVRGVRWTIVDGNPLVVRGSITTPQYLSDRAGGIWLTTTLEMHPLLGLEPGGMAFKYPARVGDTYLAVPYGEARVASLDQSISVPAGTYRCVLYEETFGGSSCIAPGVGLVHTRSPAIVVYDEEMQVVERYHLVAELVRTTRD